MSASSVLVGVDGTARGLMAARWAAAHAPLFASAGAQGSAGEASLELICVIEPGAMSEAGVSKDEARTAAQSVLSKARDEIASLNPRVEARGSVAFGKPVETLAGAAAGHALLVVGSHHGGTLGEAIGGATGLRISVLSDVPTAVIPADWEGDPADPASPVMVAVGVDDTSDAAIEQGARLAQATGRPLDLVSAWGLPDLISKPARAMGGGLDPVGAQLQARLDKLARGLRDDHEGLAVTGRAMEGPAPARVILDEAKGAALLLMGTHARGAMGRAVFGSVTHGVLQGLVTPTIIVPSA